MKILEHQACLLVGSNIQPEKNIQLALNELRDKVRILRISSVWETPSVGFAGPDFLNLAVLMTTRLKVIELREFVLRPLEKRLGRKRGPEKNAPRTIDLDIIVYDGQVLDPNLWRYPHVAVPVAEILPDCLSDQGETLRKVATRLAGTNLVRLRPDVFPGHSTIAA